MSTTDEQGKAFGYVCYICGEQIYDSQPTEHSEHGLIHLNCIPALLAANDELEKRVKELEACLRCEYLSCGHTEQYAYSDNLGKTGFCLLCKILKLEKENAELRKDKERLDWLIEWHGLNEGPLPCRDWNDAEDARQAIDSAAKEAK